MLQDPTPNHITKHSGVGVAQNAKQYKAEYFPFKACQVSMNIITLVVQISADVGQVTFYCESVHQPKKFDLFHQTIFFLMKEWGLPSPPETRPPTVTDDKFASPLPN